MADNQAMGAALYTLGQGITGASDAYFGGQIKAAQTAQAVALKTMQAKAEQEDKDRTFGETVREHNLTDADRKATLAETEKRDTASASNASARLAQTEKQNAITAGQGAQRLGIESKKADIETKILQNNLTSGAHSAANEEITRAKDDVTNLRGQQEDVQKQLAAINKSVSVPEMLTDQQKGQIKKLNAQLDGIQTELAGANNRLHVATQKADSTASELGVAPTKNPAKTVKPLPANVPSAAADYLKQHPETRQQFDQKYGQGASDSVLDE